MGPLVFLSKKRKNKIASVVADEWQTIRERRNQMREAEAAEVRERVIKRLSRDYEVGGVLGSVLFAIAAKFAANMIEEMLREYFRGMTTNEGK